MSCELIKRIYKIKPKILEININIRQIMASTLKLNLNPFSVGIMPSKTDFPKNNVGINVKIKKTNQILVDFFTILFFA